MIKTLLELGMICTLFLLIIFVYSACVVSAREDKSMEKKINVKKGKNE